MAALRAGLEIAAGPARDDSGDHREGLGVVDEGRLAVEAFRRRIRRLLLGLAAPAFDALQQDRLFAQHVRAL